MVVFVALAFFGLPGRVPAQPAPDLLVEWEIDTHPSSAIPLPATLRGMAIGTLTGADLTRNRIVDMDPFPDCMSAKDDTPELPGDFYAIGWPAQVGSEPITFGCNMQFSVAPQPGFVWKPTRLTFALWIHSGNALGPVVLQLIASVDGTNWTQLGIWRHPEDLPANDQQQRKQTVEITDEQLTAIGVGPGLSAAPIVFRLVGAHKPGGHVGSWGGFSNTTKYPGEGSNLLLEGMVAVEPLFSPGAIQCQKKIGRSTHRLTSAVHKQHVRCLNREAAGAICNTAKRDGRIAARIGRAKVVLDASCTLSDYLELGFEDQLTSDQIRDAIVQDVIDTAVDLIRATYPAGYVNKP